MEYLEKTQEIDKEHICLEKFGQIEYAPEGTYKMKYEIFAAWFHHLQIFLKLWVLPDIQKRKVSL